MAGTAIWLASVPKSGNTWIRLMLRALQAETTSTGLSSLRDFGSVVSLRDWIDKTLEIESSHLTPAEVIDRYPSYHDALFMQGEPRLVKVHDAWLRTTTGEPAYAARQTRSAIYALRDPRDVAVSWARFTGKSIDWAIADLSGRGQSEPTRRNPTLPGLPFFVGNWSAHIGSWVDESGLAPLVVRYEAMKADPAVELSRMAAHLGWLADAARIAAAVEATRFETLAEQEQREGFWEKPASAERFFHTGRSGGWKAVLTPAQAAQIEADHGAMMARFGYR